MSTEHDDRTQQKLADLEHQIREQDRRIEQHDQRHVEQIGELLDQAVECDAGQISATATAALRDPERRLREWDLVTDDDVKWLVVPFRSGDVSTGIEVNETTRYAFSGVGGSDDVIAERRVLGGYSEYSTLDENGLPGPWSAPERDN